MNPIALTLLLIVAGCIGIGWLVHRYADAFSSHYERQIRKNAAKDRKL